MDHHAPSRLPVIAYRAENAAEVLSVSKMTINNWLREGRLVGRKAGGVTLILHEDLMAMVRSLPAAVYAEPVRG